jgi:DNA polymerase V
MSEYARNLLLRTEFEVAGGGCSVPLTIVDRIAPLTEHPTRVLVLVPSEAVHAGFPSPAQDYYDGPLDLNTHLIKDRTSTFVLRVAGDSMIGAGIADGDELVVDCALEPKDGSIVIAVLDGELTVKRLRLERGGVTLEAANPAYPSIRIQELSELKIWGVATYALHNLRHA